MTLIVCCLIAKLYLTVLQPQGLRPARFLCRGIFQARTLEWLPFPSVGDLPDPESNLLHWQVNSLPLGH